MVAVAVVAVMSNGTAGAQLALETTLAREEIDAQAEALRFIQSSYIADKDTGDDRFAEVWKNITNSAIDIKNLNSVDQEKILQYSPTDCGSLYTPSGISSQHAFIINTHYLGKYTNLDKPSVNANATNKVVARVDNDSSKFAQASTYPRLIFGSNASNNSDKDKLIATDSREDLFRAEGIYIIAVKDAGTTNIVSEEHKTGDKQAAFYDFYIRTCWYGIGDQSPSTISTVIRLYDPKVVRTD